MGKWNKIFLSITCFWALMILTGPLMLETGETGDLSGSVGLYDNKKVIQEMKLLMKWYTHMLLGKDCYKNMTEERYLINLKKD